MDSRILPEAFCAAYEGLYVRALDDGMSGRGKGDDERVIVGVVAGKPTGQARISTNETTSIGRSQGPKLKSVSRTSRTLKEEEAFRLRQKVDKRLRAMAREMIAFLEGRDLRVGVVRICDGKCKKFGEQEWVFCARCGGPMREVEDSDV